MKLPVVALAGSFAANVALLGLFSLQPQLAPPRFRDYFARRDTSVVVSRPTGESARAAVTAPRPKLWSTLDASGELSALVAALRAAGYPANIIRAIIYAQISARYDARMQAFYEADPTVPFWKQRTTFFNSNDKRIEEMNQLQRERSKLLRALFSDPFFAGDSDISAGQRRQYGNLSQQKIDQVQRIEEDYQEMNSAVRSAMGGVTLPEDREKLALLAREKRADLAAILTPAELADYELRSSPVTARLRSQLATFDPSEEEFRAIYNAQRALNDKFVGFEVGGMDFQLRQTAQKAFYDDIHAALGDARFAVYTRELDREYQALNRLAQRDNLPASAPQQAFSLRENVATESNRIFDDGTLTNEQKRSALQLLAQNARAQLLAVLGPKTGSAYVSLAEPWLTAMGNGAAVNFNTSLPLTIMSDSGSSVMYMSGTNYRRLPAQPPTH